MKYLFYISIITLIFICKISAQPGSLDNRFGNEGIVQIQFKPTVQYFPKLISQQDGKILCYIKLNFDTLCLYRFLQDGKLDSGFAKNGVSITTGFINATAIGLQNDGKIIVSGFTKFSKQYLLRRFLPQGQLDSSFGENGTISNTLDGQISEILDISVRADNKIVAVGTFADNDATSDIFVAQFLPNGLIDSTFGNETGKSRILRTVYGNAIDFQQNGSILIGGSEQAGDRFLLARFTPNGIIDSSFGEAGNGLVKTDFDRDREFINNIVIQPDDKILAVGSAMQGGFGGRIPYIAMARYLKDGRLDPDFGVGGKVKLKFPEYSEGFGLALQPNGKIVISGFTSKLKSDYVLARYSSDGLLDSSFGENGVVLTDLGTNDEKGYDLIIQQNGRIVVRGEPGITLLGFEGDRLTLITKIKRWIHSHILHFSDANGIATQYTIEHQNSGGGFSTIASLLPNKNNTYNYDISNYTSATTNNNFRIKAVYVDGSTVYSEVVSEAALQTSKQSSVFPNPASTIITINGLDKTKNYHIIIRNKAAQKLLQVAATSVTQKQIDIATLQPGIYFIELKDDTGEVVRLKMVKE